MKKVNMKDLVYLEHKLLKLQDQADKIRKAFEKKIGCTLEEANEEKNYKNPLLAELLAIDGSIEGAIENVYNI